MQTTSDGPLEQSHTKNGVKDTKPWQVNVARSGRRYKALLFAVFLLWELMMLLSIALLTVTEECSPFSGGFPRETPREMGPQGGEGKASTTWHDVVDQLLPAQDLGGGVNVDVFAITPNKHTTTTTSSQITFSSRQHLHGAGCFCKA